MVMTIALFLLYRYENKFQAKSVAWLRGWDYSRDISAGEETENRRSAYGITKICKNKNKGQKPSSDGRIRIGGARSEKSQAQKSLREHRTGASLGC